MRRIDPLPPLSLDLPVDPPTTQPTCLGLPPSAQGGRQARKENE
jgi:hypothetical protein